MILLWLATSVICQQQDTPPVDPIVYGGPRNSGWVFANEARPVVPEPYTVDGPVVKARPVVDIAPLVEYHQRLSLERQFKAKASPLAQAIQTVVIEPPNIDPWLEEMAREFQLQQQVLFLLEVEYAEAAEAAFAWMMQET